MEIVKDTGLLHSMYNSIDGEESKMAEFIHLSVQELLAMSRLAGSSTEIEEVFTAMWKSRRLSMAQLYICGLLCDTGFPINRAILNAVNPNLRDNTDVSDVLIKVVLVGMPLLNLILFVY